MSKAVAATQPGEDFQAVEEGGVHQFLHFDNGLENVPNRFSRSIFIAGFAGFADKLAFGFRLLAVDG